MKVLVVGATGSIGRVVVREALSQGHSVRAIARSVDKAAGLPSGCEVFIGDVDDLELLEMALDGVDAIVFTLGSGGQGREGPRSVDYGGVRNVLLCLNGRTVRIALMTTVGVTDRAGSFQSHDWKRRSERLVRSSGLDYTIVRPGWFDYNGPGQLRLSPRQGDRRQSGTPKDGVISRSQLAQVLVASLTSIEARRKTFELVATDGARSTDLEAIFAALKTDGSGSIDGVEDLPNMPLDDEPESVIVELRQVKSSFAV